MFDRSLTPVSQYRPDMTGMSLFSAGAILTFVRRMRVCVQESVCLCMYHRGQRFSFSSSVPDQCDCHSQSALRGEPVPIFINGFIFISRGCHSSPPLFNAAAAASEAARFCLLSSGKLITQAITAKVPAVKQQWLLISINCAHLLISPPPRYTHKHTHKRRNSNKDDTVACL